MQPWHMVWAYIGIHYVVLAVACYVCHQRSVMSITGMSCIHIITSRSSYLHAGRLFSNSWLIYLQDSIRNDYNSPKESESTARWCISRRCESPRCWWCKCARCYDTSNSVVILYWQRVIHLVVLSWFYHCCPSSRSSDFQYHHHCESTVIANHWRTSPQPVCQWPFRHCWADFPAKVRCSDAWFEGGNVWLGCWLCVGVGVSQAWLSAIAPVFLLMPHPEIGVVTPPGGAYVSSHCCSEPIITIHCC